jgi:hypothetical protein
LAIEDDLLYAVAGERDSERVVLDQQLDFFLFAVQEPYVGFADGPREGMTELGLFHQGPRSCLIVSFP